MVKHTIDTVKYYTHLESPRVIFLSGMHGNEAESSELLEQWLIENAETLDSFLFIPQVSPSAVRQGTRRNAQGNDINRQFIEETTDQEVLQVMKILKGQSAILCLDVHEDPDRTQGFYIYDTGVMTKQELETYREAIQKTPFKPYSGIDDIDDEHLQRMIEQGYVSLRPTDSEVSAGFGSVWMLKHHIVSRVFTMEVPGKAAKEDKAALIRTMVPFLLGAFGVS